MFQSNVTQKNKPKNTERKESFVELTEKYLKIEEFETYMIGSYSIGIKIHDRNYYSECSLNECQSRDFFISKHP